MSRPLIERSRSLVDQSSLSARNKKLVRSFVDHCFATGLGEQRVAKYLWQLRKLGAWLAKDFDKASKDDIVKLVARIETEPIAAWTKSDHKVAIRKFYKWLNGGEECPETVRWIRTRLPRYKQVLPADLLTQDDVNGLVAAADHPRDRAFVACLYESGARIGEMIGVRLKDLAFDSDGAQISLSGKTGSRRIRLVAAIPYLTEWLNQHPRSNDRSAHLWVSREGTIRVITYNRIRDILVRLRNRAEIQKPINPHHFRHSRATYLANYLTEAQMKAYLGWVQGSEMAAVYVHLSGRDVDSAILRLNGMQRRDDHEDRAPTVRECSRCRQPNAQTNAFCARCGFALDEEIRGEIVRRDLAREQLEGLLDKLVESGGLVDGLENARRPLWRQRRTLAGNDGGASRAPVETTPKRR